MIHVPPFVEKPWKISWELKSLEGPSLPDFDPEPVVKKKMIVFIKKATRTISAILRI